MEDKYKIFSEQYNKILDLIELSVPDVVVNYKNLISNLPNMVKEKLLTKEQFVCDGKGFRAILEVYEDELVFEFINYGKYLSRTVTIKPFYEDEIIEDKDINFSDSENDFFMFSFTMVNTEDDPTIKFNYEEKDGNYNYLNSKVDGVEIDCEVFLEKLNGEFYLVVRKNFNGVEVCKKEYPVSYQSLIDCVDVEYDDNYNDIYDEQD